MTTTTTTTEPAALFSSARSPSTTGIALPSKSLLVAQPAAPLPEASSLVPVDPQRPFRCSYPGCYKAFPKRAKLDRHRVSHSDQRPFVCQHPGCDASYKRSEHLNVHQRCHQDSSQRRFRCDHPGCSLAFWTSTHLKNHVKSVHTDQMLKIGSRTIHLPPSSSLSIAAPGSPGSESLASLTQYRCTEPGCSETFHKRKVLRAHIREAHSDLAVSVAQSQRPSTLSLPVAPGAAVSTEIQKGRDGDNVAETLLLPFPCSHPGCSMRFATNAKRRSHFKTHEAGRYTCSMAHAAPQRAATSASTTNQGPGTHVYVFPNWSALQDHMKQAHPPACPWPGCGKSFSRHDSLRAHYRRHEKRKLDLQAEAEALASPSDRPLAKTDGYTGQDTDSESEDEHVPKLDAEQRSSALPCRQSGRPIDFDALASDLSRNRPRRSSRLLTPDLSAGNAGSPTPSQTGSSPVPTLRQSPSAGIFTCSWNGCGRTYTRKSGLSIHVRTRHLGELPFECAGCQRKFAHKHLVTRHRRTCPALGPLATLRAAQADRVDSSLDRTALKGDDGTNASGSRSASGEASEDGGAGMDEDDYFRSEGGAVPERDAERGGAGQVHHEGEKPASALQSRLLDLLTGRRYHGLASVPNGSSCGGIGDGLGNLEAATNAAEGDRPTKRRRTARDRVFHCPWQSIVEALRGDTPAGTASDDHQQAKFADVQAGSDWNPSAAGCGYRFSRIYDLRRHLKASHGLELEDGEIRQWLHERQSGRLPQGSIDPAILE